MHLSDYLSEIAESYDSNAGLSTPTQLMLRNADAHLAEHVPVEFLINGSGGQGVPTFTPWISFLLPDETKTVQDGLYVVYLFSRDLKRVTLTLMHGVTRLTTKFGTKAARARLSKIAVDVRNGLPEDEVAVFDTRLELGVGGWRQQAYAAATIVAKEYFFISFPSEQDLIQDLNTFFDLYYTAIELKSASIIPGDPIAETKAAVVGQEFNSSSASRKVIEMAAMQAAIAYYKSEGWQVEDTSSNNPYDLRCTKREESELRVEVKGTTGDGSSVLLTRGEVIHAQEHPRVDLFIFFGLTVQQDGSGEPEILGGETVILSPWKIDTGKLSPIAYEYFPG